MAEVTKIHAEEVNPERKTSVTNEILADPILLKKVEQLVIRRRRQREFAALSLGGKIKMIGKEIIHSKPVKIVVTGVVVVGTALYVIYKVTDRGREITETEMIPGSEPWDVAEMEGLTAPEESTEVVE